MFVTQLVMLFGKVMAPLGSGASLENGGEPLSEGL